MIELYPLCFSPIFKEKIWGGQKIKNILKKDTGDLANCGESWEISGVAGNISEVSNGSLRGEKLDRLIQIYKDQLLGDSVYRKFGDDFPLLIKFIDADEDLSIQVHPDDALAMERHNSFGKTEMWYILHADPGATLISGFNRSMDKESYIEYFNSGRLGDILNKENVNKDDVFFLPAGRIHTIGRGLLLAEIQQTSDITYRIHDFDRIDVNGNKRELHLEQSLEALDFTHYTEYKTPYESKFNEANPVVECKYFRTNILRLDQPILRDYSKIDSFMILIGLEGELQVKYARHAYSLKKGETMLIPACLDNIELLVDQQCKVLETFVPPNKVNR